MTVFDIDSPDFKQQTIEHGTITIRKIIASAGFGPYVPDPLPDLLIEAWMEGIKYGASAMAEALPDRISETVRNTLLDAVKETIARD